MLLCLDVGNTNLYAGVLEGENVRETFRRDMRAGTSADEFGLFLRSALRENDVDPSSIEDIGISCVVPSALHSLRGACEKYFGIDPFVLQAGVATGLRITIRNPVEVGADRIANAIAGVNRFPGKDLVIVDFGTATTCCAVTAKKDYLGGAILPGVRISMESLSEKTARLSKVEIIETETALGRSTVEAIQAGIVLGHLGAVREIITRLKEECFPQGNPLVIGTGGFSRLFARYGLFDEVAPNLVLDGVRIALQLNRR